MNAFRLICLSSLVCAIAPVISQPALAAAPERALYAFKSSPDGWEPSGGLVTDGSGSFYGTTASGGTCIYDNRCGTVFRLTQNGSSFTESVLYAFQARTDGVQPVARVTLDARGDIFGTTDQGGAYDGGTVFELVPGASGYTETVLWSFGGRAGDGTDPSGGVLLDSSGALYGVTYAGGGNGCSNFGGCGTIYRLTPSNSGYSESVLYRFTGGGDGAGPTGELIADTSGRLYGTATSGGNPGCSYFTPGCGTAFALTPSGSTYVFSTLYAFGTGSDGRFPAGTLLRDNAGILYGATSDGGLRNGCGYGCGTIFALTPASGGYAESILYGFQGLADGSFPNGGLVADANGNLYDTTRYGHPKAYEWGTAFKLTKTPSGYVHTVLYQFSAKANGHWPSPLLLSGGTLFGETSRGGEGRYGGYGTIFSLGTQ